MNTPAESPVTRRPPKSFCNSEAAYTLVEVAIVLALAAALGVFGASSFRKNNRVQTFTDNMRIIASFVRESQVRSYAIIRDETLGGETARGTYVEIDIGGQELNEYFMAGDRVARASGADQREGITDFGASGRSVDLEAIGLRLSEVKYDATADTTTNSGSPVAGTPKVISFAPDGRIYFLRTGEVTTAPPAQYRSTGGYKLFFCDSGTELQGMVTINSVSGIIKTKVSESLTSC